MGASIMVANVSLRAAMTSDGTSLCAKRMNSEAVETARMAVNKAITTFPPATWLDGMNVSWSGRDDSRSSSICQFYPHLPLNHKTQNKTERQSFLRLIIYSILPSNK